MFADPNTPGYLILGVFALALQYVIIKFAVRNGIEDRDRRRAKKERA
jgi:hypothetical protein